MRPVDATWVAERHVVPDWQAYEQRTTLACSGCEARLSDATAGLHQQRTGHVLWAENDKGRVVTPHSGRLARTVAA